MPTAVLDTSVLVRYLTNDDPVKAGAAAAYLRRQPVGSLLMPDVAVAELAFVLLRVYRWNPSQVAAALRAVVSHHAIIVPGRELWLDVADDLENGRGPVDAYLLRTAERQGMSVVITFDERMKPLPTVQPLSP